MACETKLQSDSLGETTSGTRVESAVGCTDDAPKDCGMRKAVNIWKSEKRLFLNTNYRFVCIGKEHKTLFSRGTKRNVWSGRIGLPGQPLDRSWIPVQPLDRSGHFWILTFTQVGTCWGQNHYSAAAMRGAV